MEKKDYLEVPEGLHVFFGDGFSSGFSISGGSTKIFWHENWPIGSQSMALEFQTACFLRHVKHRCSSSWSEGPSCRSDISPQDNPSFITLVAIGMYNRIQPGIIFHVSNGFWGPTPLGFGGFFMWFLGTKTESYFSDFLTLKGA